MYISYCFYTLGILQDVRRLVDLKICEKCGKANDVTRKYCTRCGASLIKKDTEEKPMPAEAPSEASSEEVVSPPAREVTELSSSVVPEEVAMEGTVVETREDISPPPVVDEVSIPSEEEEMPAQETMDEERGRETVREILAKVKAAEARAREEDASPPLEAGAETPMAEETLPEEVEAPVAEETEAEETYEEEPEPTPPPIVHREEYAPAPRAAVSMATAEPAKDEKIRSIEADIKAYTIEHQQLHSEYDKLKIRLDEEVERYHIAAETKRTRADGIERELRLAKKEFDDANKEHKNADNRRKKELSNAEKRINDVEKRIKKAQDSKDKRIQEIEKERRKREEEAAKS
jgi:ribosomal protein L40E